MTNNLLQRPSYNRRSCRAGIVHLGVGNFHRAHQAYYINEYLNKIGIRVLKLGLTYPLEPIMIDKFSEGLNELFVHEINAFKVDASIASTRIFQIEVNVEISGKT